jgi:hypothetical protein
MKIRINKNQQAINFQTHLGTIVMIAEQKAKAGYDRFSYPIPRNQGIDTYTLIEEVENETEQSVYGKIKDGYIKFSIRD